MTVPHLMNCPHNDDGWCLDCVADLGNQSWKLREALAALCEAADSTNYPQHGPNWDRLRNALVSARQALGPNSCLTTRKT